MIASSHPTKINSLVLFYAQSVYKFSISRKKAQLCRVGLLECSLCRCPAHTGWPGSFSVTIPLPYFPLQAMDSCSSWVPGDLNEVGWLVLPWWGFLKTPSLAHVSGSHDWSMREPFLPVQQESSSGSVLLDAGWGFGVARCLLSRSTGFQCLQPPQPAPVALWLFPQPLMTTDPSVHSKWCKVKIFLVLALNK